MRASLKRQVKALLPTDAAAFRVEVTLATVDVLLRAGGDCPDCGQQVALTARALTDHAEGFGCWLRADVADGL